MAKRTTKNVNNNELDGKEFFAAIAQIEQEKGIKPGYMMEKITQALLSAYRRDCVTLGKQVQLLWQEDRREVVEALDVDDQFGLVVRHEDGRTEVIRSGEVSVRGMYGYIE